MFSCFYSPLSVKGFIRGPDLYYAQNNINNNEADLIARRGNEAGFLMTIPRGDCGMTLFWAPEEAEGVQGWGEGSRKREQG